MENAFGQAEAFRFDMTCENPRISTSKITVIDKRLNPEMRGFVPFGKGLSLSYIPFKGSFADSLARMIVSDTVQNSVKILNDFFINGAAKQTKFVWSFQLFQQLSDSNFKEIASVDTIFFLKGKPYEEVNKTICNIAQKIAAGTKWSCGDTGYGDWSREFCTCFRYTFTFIKNCNYLIHIDSPFNQPRNFTVFRT